MNYKGTVFERKKSVILLIKNTFKIFLFPFFDVTLPFHLERELLILITDKTI